MDTMISPLAPIAWTAHLDAARYDAVIEGDMQLCVTIRPAFRSVTVAIFPSDDGDRFLPGGTAIKRVPLYLLPD
jgi:hypothetical protein